MRIRTDALVVGAGPGGLTCLGNLLDRGLKRVAIADPTFTAGRIADRYREVPSNTKVKMFDGWARGTESFTSVLDTTPQPNAYTKLKSFDQESGCSLGDAIDVAKMLSDGLRKDGRVHSIQGRVDELQFSSRGHWQAPQHELETSRVALAVGSHPRPFDLHTRYGKKELELDTALKPSLLKQTLPQGSKVAVIGSSHSAILALKNIHEAGYDVVNFFRSPLLYAEYKDGWILYDNTGLKGVAADWARAIPTKIVRHELDKDESAYRSSLEDVTHICAAVGYVSNPVPRIVVDGKDVKPEFDPLSGTFNLNGERLPGLFGAGIAYPERVTDKAGNVESAVGWFKFMKFVKRVSPGWVDGHVAHS